METVTDSVVADRYKKSAAYVASWRRKRLVAGEDYEPGGPGKSVAYLAPGLEKAKRQWGEDDFAWLDEGEEFECRVVRLMPNRKWVRVRRGNGEVGSVVLPKQVIPHRRKGMVLRCAETEKKGLYLFVKVG